MRVLFFLLPKFTATVLILLLALATLQTAYADDYQVFNISATLQSGAQVSGTATLDISPPDGVPYFASCNITSTDGGGVVLTTVSYQGGGGQGTWVEDAFVNPNSTAGLIIYIQATGGSLTDYQGGPILPTVYNGTAVSELYYQDANGNSVQDNLVSGSLEPAVPLSTKLAVVSPYLLTTNLANIDLTALLPGVPDLSAVAASGLAADGISGAIVLFSTTTSGDVTLTSDNGTLLFPYYPNYFPVPDIGYVGSTRLVISSYNMFQIGSLFYAAAILQAPYSTTHHVLGAPIAVTAQQNGGNVLRQSLPLVPPPVIFVHGLWGNTDALNYVSKGLGASVPWSNYPKTPFYPVVYSGDVSFASPSSLKSMDIWISKALGVAQHSGAVVGRVDIVAHSMGGLLARQFTSASDYYSLQDREQGKFHAAVTLDTPEEGSELASFLLQHKDDTLQATADSDPLAYTNWHVGLGCSDTETVAQCLASNKHPVTLGAVDSLVPYNQSLLNAPNPDFANAQWNAVSATSTTGGLREGLNLMIRAIFTSEAKAPSVDSIVGTPDDAIVWLNSQLDYAMAFVTFPSLSHSPARLWGQVSTAPSVLNSHAVVKEVACWLRDPTDVCPLRQKDFVLTSLADESSYARLVPSKAAVRFSLSAVLGKPSLVQVITPKVVQKLSIDQVGPYDHSEGHDPDVISDAPKKAGSFSFNFIPRELGIINITTTAMFSDGSYDIKRTKMDVFVDPASIERLDVNRGSLERLQMKRGETIDLVPEIIVRGLEFPVTVGKEAKFEVVTNESNLPVFVSKDLVLTALQTGSAVIRVSFAGKTDQIHVDVAP